MGMVLINGRLGCFKLFFILFYFSFINLYFCVVADSQPSKECEGGHSSGAVTHEGGETDKEANSAEKSQVVDSATSQEDEAKDVEKDKESLAGGLAMGLGMSASDYQRLQANAREFLCLSSPVRRTLVGSLTSASAAPSTPLNHSTPQGPPPLERSQSGLSTDGELCLSEIIDFL